MTNNKTLIDAIAAVLATSTKGNEDEYSFAYSALDGGPDFLAPKLLDRAQNAMVEDPADRSVAVHFKDAYRNAFLDELLRGLDLDLRADRAVTVAIDVRAHHAIHQPSGDEKAQ